MSYLLPTASIVGAFLFLAVPLLLLIYLGFLLFIRPPKKVLFASLLGGITMGLINLLVDIAAYYAHWWHYTLKELVSHVPLPFYISPVLVFGSLAYLLIWRFGQGRSRWFALLLLIGVPLFCIVRDVSGGLTHTAYQEWENGPVATLITIAMWIVAFYAGFWLFWRTAAHIDPQIVQDEPIRRIERHEASKPYEDTLASN
jgi:uncharacterized membrane protein